MRKLFSICPDEDFRKKAAELRAMLQPAEESRDAFLSQLSRVYEFLRTQPKKELFLELRNGKFVCIKAEDKKLVFFTNSVENGLESNSIVNFSDAGEVLDFVIVDLARMREKMESGTVHYKSLEQVKDMDPATLVSRYKSSIQPYLDAFERAQTVSVR